LAWNHAFPSMMTEFQAGVESILGADPGTVVPMENVTRGFAAVSSLWDWRAQEGGKRNRVVMTDQEFSTSYPFFKGLERMGAELVLVNSKDGITVDLEDWMRVLDERVLLVATSHVFFRSGFIQNLKAITQKAHSVGAYVLGDGYQCVGTVPFSVKDLGVDFYVGGSHKLLCGGPGAGFLYVSPEFLRDLNSRSGGSDFRGPALSGWFGLENPFTYQPGTDVKLATGVSQFMAGTPSIPALYAARSGLDWVRKVGLSEIRRHSIELTERVRIEGQKRGWTLRSPLDPSERSGMVCFDFPEAQSLTASLEARGIIVDYRPRAGMRVSPHFYSNQGDIDRLLSAIDLM